MKHHGMCRMILENQRTGGLVAVRHHAALCCYHSTAKRFITEPAHGTAAVLLLAVHI